jgi:hypothetical protein
MRLSITTMKLSHVLRRYVTYILIVFVGAALCGGQNIVIATKPEAEAAIFFSFLMVT